MISDSITAVQNQKWLMGSGSLKLSRYLRRHHHRDNWETVFNLLFGAYPDEGRKLVENYDKLDFEKKELLVKWIIFEPQITALILGDQRMGKDALICKIFEDVINYCLKHHLIPPRFVTLGNTRCPPFVDEWFEFNGSRKVPSEEILLLFDELNSSLTFEIFLIRKKNLFSLGWEYFSDMFFSFRNIPSGKEIVFTFPDGFVKKGIQEVWIYSSEIEAMLSARDPTAPESKLFSILEGTIAQNNQKLFGGVKLTSKVDLNVIRSCNVKIFKFISPEKLNIEGIERANVLSDLGRWLLPKNKRDKSETLLHFDNQLLTTNYNLPVWWTEEYSEQFKNVPIDKVFDFIDCVLVFDSDKLTNAQVNVIQIAVFQKFRKKISRKVLLERFNYNLEI